MRLPESERAERKRQRRERVVAEEYGLRQELPELAEYITELEKRAPRGRSVARLRRVGRMLRDYPRKPFLEALREAAHYGLYDLDRVEKMILERIQGNFFPRLGAGDEDDR